MKTWVVNARDVLRAQLWPIPTLAVMTALRLGFGIPELDAVVDARLSDQAGGWLFGGDADAARSLLGADDVPAEDSSDTGSPGFQAE